MHARDTWTGQFSTGPGKKSWPMVFSGHCKLHMYLFLGLPSIQYTLENVCISLGLVSKKCKNGHAQSFFPTEISACRMRLTSSKLGGTVMALQGCKAGSKSRSCLLVFLFGERRCQTWGFQIPIFLGSIFLDPIFLGDPCSWVPGLNPPLLLDLPSPTHQKPL